VLLAWSPLPNRSCSHVGSIRLVVYEADTFQIGIVHLHIGPLEVEE
jgi:hypothetical protein